MKTPSTNTAPNAPWYKQFWPWFLIVLPAAAVIASFISLDIAITHADTPVEGDYVQHGLTVLHKQNLPSPTGRGVAGEGNHAIESSSH